jgi:nucleoside-diphosphate-sugar epimerase
MNILVTGTEGYIGCMMAPLLMQRGHDVLGVDTGFYREGWLYHGTPRSPRTLIKDIRHLEAEDLAGINAVVHCGELSNDPAGELAPHITFDINHKASIRLAELSKAAGVQRFVYMSSCSVYGLGSGDDFVDETSPVDPQTTYAKCKTLVERDLSAMASDEFTPTYMRNATAFGASPRMRFDCVLNNLAGLAWTIKKIAMTSDGTPWRPIVHLLDIAKAAATILEAPAEAVHDQAFNVGSTQQNYRVREIAETVAEAFPGCEVSFGQPSPDNRSYRVSFDKIAKALPNFECDWDPARGARQLHEVFSQINMPEETFTFRGFTRLKQLRHLLDTRQIDADFFWAADNAAMAGGLQADAV